MHKYLLEAHPLPPYTHWHLHSAWPMGSQSSRRRRFLEKALLGENSSSRSCSFIMTFSAAFSWQEVLKKAADGGERVADRISKKKPDKATAAVVAGLQAQSPKLKLPMEATERADIDGAAQLEQDDASSLLTTVRGESPRRTYPVPPGRHPSERNAPWPKQQDARPDATPRPPAPPPAFYPDTHSMVPYAPMRYQYQPPFDPFSPTGSQLPQSMDPSLQPSSYYPSPWTYAENSSAAYNSGFPNQFTSKGYLQDPYPNTTHSQPIRYREDSYDDYPRMRESRDSTRDYSSQGRDAGRSSQRERSRRRYALRTSGDRLLRDRLDDDRSSSTGTDDARVASDDSWDRRPAPWPPAFLPKPSLEEASERAMTAGRKRHVAILPPHETTHRKQSAITELYDSGDESDDFEANNAAIDDDVLSNKMLVKYTNSSFGGVGSQVSLNVHSDRHT